MSNGKEINNGDTCFFNHIKHSIVARFISKTPPQTTRQLFHPPGYPQNLLVSLWKRIASTSLTPTGSAGINRLLKK